MKRVSAPSNELARISSTTSTQVQRQRHSPLPVLAEGASVLLDCDPGVDDALALALLVAAHHEKRIALEALAIVHGNSLDVERLAKNARLLLHAMRASSIPVFTGASVPLLGSHNNAHFVHGEPDALGGVSTMPFARALEAKRARVDDAAEDAAHAIVRLAREHSARGKPLVLCAIGPLTNLALALTLEPSLPSLCPRIYVMGGAVAHQGNVTMLAEANVYDYSSASRF